MGGFVKSAANTTTSDGHFAMSNYEETDLPFYFFLANTYALGDRHFSDGVGHLCCNFMMFGTNAGIIDTGLVFPDPATPSLMQV